MTDVVTRRIALFFLAALAAQTAGCNTSVVKRVGRGAIEATPGNATLIVIASPRAQYGPVWIGDAPGAPPEFPRLIGACVQSTYFVREVPAGRHIFVAFDDDSYDAAEGDLEAGQIYTLLVDHGMSELDLLAARPDKKAMRRMLDESDRVDLAGEPPKDEQEKLKKKAPLAKYRYAQYPERKRAERFLGPDHAWR
jgi:hypothetical protein